MENVSVWTLVSISKYVKVYYNLVSEILNWIPLGFKLHVKLVNQHARIFVLFLQ